MMFAVFTDASLSGLPNQRPTRSSSFTQKPTLASSLIEQKHRHAKITPIPIKEVVHGLIPYVQQQKIKGTTMMLVESRPAATPKSCSMTTASHLMIKARSQPMIKGIIPGKSRIFSDLGTSRVPTSSASLVSSDFLVQTTTTTTPTSLNASPSQHHDRNTLSLTQTWTHDNFKTLYRKATTTKTEVSTLTSQLVEQTVPAQGSLSSQVNEPTGFELPGLPSWTIWIFVPIITFGFLLAAKIYQDARRPVYPKRHQERGSNRYTGRGTTRDEYASSQEAVHNARTLAPNGIRRESDEGGSGSHGPVLHHEDLGSLRRMVLPASYRPDYHEPTHKKRYDQRGASTSSHYLGSPGYSTSSAFASPLQSPSDGIHRMSVPTTPVVANDFMSLNPTSALRHRVPPNITVDPCLANNSSHANSSALDVESQTPLPTPHITTPSYWLNNTIISSRPQHAHSNSSNDPLAPLNKTSSSSSFIANTVNAVADRIIRFTQDDGTEGRLLLPVTRKQRQEATHGATESGYDWV